jgi:hypothetical protein
MRTGVMNKWGRLKNADLVLIRSSYFPSIGTAVQAANSYIVVHCSRDYLDPLKVTGKDYYVTSSCVSLGRKKEETLIKCYQHESLELYEWQVQLIIYQGCILGGAYV